MLEPNGNIGVSWLHSQTLLYKREHRRFTTQAWHIAGQAWHIAGHAWHIAGQEWQ